MVRLNIFGLWALYHQNGNGIAVPCCDSEKQLVHCGLSCMFHTAIVTSLVGVTRADGEFLDFQFDAS